MRRTTLLMATMALTLLVASGVALAVTRIGTNDPDTVRGTNKADTLLGLGGNDRILGRLRGNDTLLGGPGKDVVIRGGTVLDPTDSTAQATREFNERIARDPRLFSIALPLIRERIDGLTITRIL